MKATAADTIGDDTTGTAALEASGDAPMKDVQPQASSDADETVAVTGENKGTIMTPKKAESTPEQQAKAPSETGIVKAKPRFHVNDNSKIEIIVTSHEFETSMATNDFSAQSTEASVSGGFGGFGASVSAGYASSESSTFKQTNNKYEKTMIAKYLVRYTSLQSFVTALICR